MCPRDNQLQGKMLRKSAGNSLRNRILHFRFSVCWFLKLEILFIVIVSFLSALGYLPSSLSYSIDAINIILLLISFPKLPSAFKETKSVAWAILLFCALCLASAVINLVSPVLVIWEAMCLWRIFIYICLAMIYWSWNDFERLMNLFVKLQLLNVIFVLVEFFILGLSQDNLGGMFGIEAGCNAGLNIYMCIVVAWCLRCYIAKNIKVFTLAMTMITCLLIAAIAELKIFYFEFLVIVFIQILFNYPTKKTFGILIGSLLAIWLGLLVFSIVFPAQFKLLADLDSLMTYADNTNLDSGYGVSRINVFGQISDQFFHNDLFLEMFGFGFGSTTMSSIPFFTSTFSILYEYMKYYYLQTAMVFLQIGFVGTVSYLFPFVLMQVHVLKGPSNSKLHLMGIRAMYISLFIMFLLNCMYNNTAHTYYALMWAIVLVGPLLYLKGRVEK